MKALDHGRLWCNLPNDKHGRRCQNLSNTRVTRQWGGEASVLLGIYGGCDYPDHANDVIVRFAMIETAEALIIWTQFWALRVLMQFTWGRRISLSLGCKPTLMKSIHLWLRQSTIPERATAHGLKAGIHNGTTATAKNESKKAFGLSVLRCANHGRWITDDHR